MARMAGVFGSFEIALVLLWSFICMFILALYIVRSIISSPEMIKQFSFVTVKNENKFEESSANPVKELKAKNDRKLCNFLFCMFGHSKSCLRLYILSLGKFPA